MPLKPLLCLLLLATAARAADDRPDYAARAIPESLRTNAHAVLRRHETTFTVKNPGEATERVHLVVTVLDASGQDAAKAVVFYDKQQKVNEFEGHLYDENGKEIRRLKKADVQDVSAVSSGSLFEDNRAKVGEFAYANFPYTVEFTYQTTTSNLLFYPAWFPHQGSHRSLESARLSVRMPAGLRLRYRELNGLAPARVDSSAAEATYAWQVGPLPAREAEALTPARADQGPGVLTAPSRFAVEGYTGDLTSWRDLGQFFYTLNAGRDALPESLRQQVRDLTTGLADPGAKVRKVYEFLQQHTRYVSIQLGLGGWQTFPASTVAETGYGDCKALSNYTRAMLGSIGIASHWALVRAGDDEPDVLPDFPAVQFNHMVLCVPLPKDTLWLECTSQDDPAGYAGRFTGDRHALLVTPEGGKLVSTPRYAAADNGQFRRTRVTLTPEGDATAEVVTRYTGLQHDTRRAVRSQLSPDEQREWLYKQIKVPSFDLTRFALQPDAQGQPALTETLALTVRKCAARSGTRLFLTPNLLTAWSSLPPATPRSTDFVTPMSFVDTDTVSYRLPAGFAPEFLPDPVRLESKFGRYEASLRVADGTLTYLRRMEMQRATFPPGAYGEFVEFCRKIAKADRTQVVLVKKE